MGPAFAEPNDQPQVVCWSSNAAKTSAEFLAVSSGRDSGMLRKIVLRSSLRP